MEMNDTPQDKYLTALAKYDTQLNDADVQVQVAALIEKKVPENNTEEVKKFLFNCIDLTTLNTTDSDESVMRFLQMRTEKQMPRSNVPERPSRLSESRHWMALRHRLQDLQCRQPERL